jgi:hypothetical protein
MINIEPILKPLHEIDQFFRKLRPEFSLPLQQHFANFWQSRSSVDLLPGSKPPISIPLSASLGLRSSGSYESSKFPKLLSNSSPSGLLPIPSKSANNNNSDPNQYHLPNLPMANNNNNNFSDVNMNSMNSSNPNFVSNSYSLYRGSVDLPPFLSASNANLLIPNGNSNSSSPQASPPHHNCPDPSLHSMHCLPSPPLSVGAFSQQQQQQPSQSLLSSSSSVNSHHNNPYYSLKRKSDVIDDAIDLSPSLFDASISCSSQFCFFNPSLYANDFENVQPLFSSADSHQHSNLLFDGATSLNGYHGAFENF